MIADMGRKPKKWPAASWPGRLIALQAKLGLENDEMAARIGCSLRAYESWKWGERDPNRVAQHVLANLEKSTK